MQVARYVAMVHESESELADALRQVAERHGDEPDVEGECLLLASWSDGQVASLRPLLERYGEDDPDDEPQVVRGDLFRGPRQGGVALLRDLQDLWLLAGEALISYTLLSQAAKALRDKELEAACEAGMATTKRQQDWLKTRMKVAAPQALVVA